MMMLKFARWFCMFILVVFSIALVFYSWTYNYIQNPVFGLQYRADVHRTFKRKVIIIVGQGRSGSTFLGELFNEIEGALYLFEPLRALVYTIGASETFTTDSKELHFYRNNAARFLKSMFSCNYSTENPDILKNLDVGEFRFRSKVLTGPNFIERKEGKSVYTMVTPEKMQLVCLNRTLVVLKILSPRLPMRKMSSLVDIAKDLTDTDFRVIHLVRNPYAYLTSMLRNEWFSMSDKYSESGKKFIYERCKEQVRDMDHFNVMQYRLPRHVQYKLFRYEDLMSTVEQVMRQLEEFTSVEFSTRLKQSVAAKTNGSNQGEEDSYGTTARNATYVANRWKETAPKELVSAVKQHCKEALKKFGYSQ